MSNQKEAITSNQWELDFWDIPKGEFKLLIDLDTLLIDLSDEQGSEFSRNVLEV